MDRGEYRRHRRLHWAIREAVRERDSLNLNEGLTTYHESSTPSPYGRVAFTAGDSLHIEFVIVHDRATIHVPYRDPGDWRTARLNLQDAYDIGSFAPVAERDQLDDLPDPENQGDLAAAADYLLAVAETLR